MDIISFLRHWFLPHESNNQRAKLLHPSTLIGLIIFLFLFQTLLHQASFTWPQILGYASQIPPAEIIRLTNLERQKLNLPQLHLDSELTQAAGRKAADMFARNYWAHVSPIGTQPWAFITDSGYSYRYAGENLARDFADSQSVVNAWLASPTHKENLLSNRYQDIGVAVIDGQMDGRDTTLVVQMFGTKLSSASPPKIAQPANIQVLAADSPQTAPIPAVPSPEIAVSPNQNPNPTLSPFEISKVVTLGLLGLLAVVLVVDLLIVKRRMIVRWTSKSFAHLIFIAIIMTAAAVIFRGQII